MNTGGIRFYNINAYVLRLSNDLIMELEVNIVERIDTVYRQESAMIPRPA